MYYQVLHELKPVSKNPATEQKQKRNIINSPENVCVDVMCVNRKSCCWFQACSENDSKSTSIIACDAIKLNSHKSEILLVRSLDFINN